MEVSYTGGTPSSHPFQIRLFDEKSTIQRASVIPPFSKLETSIVGKAGISREDTKMAMAPHFGTGWGPPDMVVDL